jgi:glycerol-3-phosphate cytidylyltransferase-like family protein
VKLIAIAGGFDPIRAGHLQLIKGAWMMGDYVKVILTRDEQLIRKKG